MKKTEFIGMILKVMSTEKAIDIAKKKEKALSGVLKKLDKGFHEALIRGTAHCPLCGAVEGLNEDSLCVNCDEKVTTAFSSVERDTERGVILNVATNRSLWDAIRKKTPSEISNLNLTSALISLALEKEDLYEEVILLALRFQDNQKRAGRNSMYVEAAERLVSEL